MSDDYTDDIFTTGVLTVSGTPTAGQFDFEGDVDWFRVDLQAFFSYSFDVAPGPDDEQLYYLLRFYDASGNELAGYQSENSAPRIFAPETGTYFVGISYKQPFTGPVAYQISADLSTVDPLEHGGEVLSRTGYFSSAVIAGDSDLLSMFLARNRTYTFDVLGADSRNDRTLQDPFLEIRQPFSGFSVSDDNSGQGRDPQLTFKVPLGTPDRFELEVSGVNGSTGSYLIKVTASDDHPTGTSAYRVLEPFQIPEGNGSNAIGAFELGGDIDWFRLPLQQGQPVALDVWAESSDRGSPVLGIRDGISPGWLAGNQNLAPGERLLFVAPETRDYFIVVRNRQQGPDYVGRYTVRAEGMRAPKITSIPYIMFRNFGQSLMADGFGWLTVNPFDADLRDFHDGFDIWAASSFEVDGQVFEGNQVHSFELPAASVELPDGPAEAYVRPTHRGTPISGWAAQTMRVLPDDPRQGFAGDIGSDTFLVKKEFTFAFADSAPDYLSGELWANGFRALTNAQRELMRQAISEWDEPLSLQFTEVDLASVEPGEVDMLIYFTDLGDEWFINPDSNPKNAYDIVLNANKTIYDNPLPGTRGFYEMLRAIGKSMGAVENHDSNREHSLFGLRYNQEIYSELFPSTPTWYDLIRATHYPDDNFGSLRMYGWTQNTGNGPTVFELSGDPFVRTISQTGFDLHSIDASGQALPATIDLRAGQPSYTGTWRDRQHTYYVGLRSSVPKAVGGPADDWLSGSALGNVLQAGAGNDTLVGRQGNDYLFGGPDNDTYEYHVADGNDFIYEANAGGLDRLKVMGLTDLDNFTDDFLFHRQGSDFVMSINPNRLYGDRSEQITMVNFENPLSRVETLELSNLQGHYATVSLPSVFALADDVPRQFGLGNLNDGFGTVAVPV